jgi:hypothetical protein
MHKKKKKVNSRIYQFCFPDNKAPKYILKQILTELKKKKENKLLGCGGACL